MSVERKRWRREEERSRLGFGFKLKWDFRLDGGASGGILGWTVVMEEVEEVCGDGKGGYGGGGFGWWRKRRWWCWV